MLAALEGGAGREGETCEEFIRRSLTHRVARRVKLADLEGNMDLRPLATITDRDAGASAVIAPRGASLSTAAF